MSKIWQFLIGVVVIAVFIAMPAEVRNGHQSVFPKLATATPTASPDCRAEVIASDGTPPPGTPHLDPRKLCDAVQQAMDEAACMGEDWHPSNNAREFCLQVQRKGCGNRNRDCNLIPSDETYYTHHH